MELGVKVPEELSVVGFDNNEMSRQADVGITTVEQNYVEIGRRSAKMIADHWRTEPCSGNAPTFR